MAIILNNIKTLVGGGGVSLPSLANPGTKEDLMLNKQLIDGEGNKVTGTFTIDEEVDAQIDLISQIKTKVNSLPNAGSGELTLQDKTVTPTTSSQTITADSGYDGLDIVTVNAIPSTYIKPTSTKSATTYTPTTTNQIISAGTYCSGAQTIKGDANLKAENIVSGVSIFGVAGSATTGGSSGGGSTAMYTCTYIANSPATGVLYYVDSDGNTNSVNLLGGNGTVQVAKGICVFHTMDGMGCSVSGNATNIITHSMVFAYSITGDFTLTY